jgi:hypothetical protein
LLIIIKLKEYSYNIGAVYQTVVIRGFEIPDLISPFIFKTNLIVFLLLCKSNQLPRQPLILHILDNNLIANFELTQYSLRTLIYYFDTFSTLDKSLSSFWFFSLHLLSHMACSLLLLNIQVVHSLL